MLHGSGMAVIFILCKYARQTKFINVGNVLSEMCTYFFSSSSCTADLILLASVLLLLNLITNEFGTAQAQHMNWASCDIYGTNLL